MKITEGFKVRNAIVLHSSPIMVLGEEIRHHNMSHDHYVIFIMIGQCVNVSIMKRHRSIIIKMT